MATAISDIAGEVVVVLKYNGQLYEGQAQLDPRDKDFFSERVGQNIAKSRARISILKDTIKNTKEEFKIKNQMWIELSRTTKYKPEEIDPTASIYKNLNSTSKRLSRLKQALVDEEKKLADYLEGLDRAIDSVQTQRKLSQEAKTN